MQPELPQPVQLPDSYLDQIASKPVVKTVNPLLLWGMIGGVLLLAIIGTVVVSSHPGGASTSSLTAVASNMASLQEVSENSQKNIQSGELKTLNSSLTLVLTNANRDIQTPLASAGIKKSELTKSAAAKKVASDIADMNKRLEDARLNAVYDRTYAREMTYAVKTLRSDMAVLYKQSGKKLKAVLATIDANLKPLSEDFEKFNTD